MSSHESSRSLVSGAILAAIALSSALTACGSPASESTEIAALPLVCGHNIADFDPGHASPQCVPAQPGTGTGGGGGGSAPPPPTVLLNPTSINFGAVQSGVAGPRATVSMIQPYLDNDIVKISQGDAFKVVQLTSYHADGTIDSQANGTGQELSISPAAGERVDITVETYPDITEDTALAGQVEIWGTSGWSAFASLSASATVVGPSRPVLIASIAGNESFSFTLKSGTSGPQDLFWVSLTNIGTAPTTFSVVQTSLQGTVGINGEYPNVNVPILPGQTTEAVLGLTMIANTGMSATPLNFEIRSPNEPAWPFTIDVTSLIGGTSSVGGKGGGGSGGGSGGSGVAGPLCSGGTGTLFCPCFVSQEGLTSCASPSLACAGDVCLACGGPNEFPCDD